MRDDFGGEIVSLNTEAYDKAASEYALRLQAYEERDKLLLAPTVLYLRSRFPEQRARTLDIGPGSGLNLAMMSREGFDVTGIEVSPRMASIAAKNAADAEIIVDDFLKWDAGPRQWEGIVSKASLHLFPMSLASYYLEKCHKLLVPGGLLYVSVTGGEVSSESLATKSDYQMLPMRFKRIWTMVELLEACQDAGLSVLHAVHEIEPVNEKTWLNAWAVRPR